MTAPFENAGMPPAIQVKVCGLTDETIAVACAESGADAIGLVFFDRSPRHVSVAQAAAIARAVRNLAVPVGVFVDESYDVIMRTAEMCALPAVQLHGNEPPLLPERLLQRGLIVIKALFQCRAPFFGTASEYRASAFLIEDGRGWLPGGNAHSWKWQSAGALDHRRPILLAGGLNRSNVTAAVAAVQPDAVDISSCVEVGPGEKSPARVKRFVAAVQQGAALYPRRRIFK